MPFHPGDLLLTIDIRAWYSNAVNTRNHVMLVLGEQEGLPLVCHLTFKSGVCIELLQRVKDKVHLHYRCLDDTYRKALVQAAHSSSGQGIRVTKEVLEKQIQASHHYPIDTEVAFTKTTRAFKSMTNTVDDPRSPTTRIQSCHEFVFKLIQHTAQRRNMDLPQSLSLPPKHAWSATIDKFASKDPACVRRYIKSIGKRAPRSTLFTPHLTPIEPKPSPIKPCLIM